MRDLYWKHTRDDLKERAAAVLAAPADGAVVSARQAAAILSGVCGLVSRRWNVDTMQRACAELARLEPLNFGCLPTGHDGRVSEATTLIAVVARSVRPLAGEANLRAALSFWACEDDPAVWNQIAA